jgi:Thrombospondin type 1 domain
MPNLIIAVIAIIITALATLAANWYGGDTFTEAKASIQAAQLQTESQQIFAAMDVYHAETGKWPQDIKELTGAGYLRSVPQGVQIAQNPPNYVMLVSALISSAHAQEVPTLEGADPGWAMPLAGRPIIYTPARVPTLTCRKFNESSRGDDGILRQAFETLPSQCYGKAGEYQVIVRKASTTLAGALPETPAEGNLPSKEMEDWWEVLPSDPVKQPIDPDKAPLPELAMTVPALDFGRVQVGEQSRSTPITLKNEGRWVASNLSVQGADGFAKVGDTCGNELNAGASCSFAVQFSPAQAANYRGAIRATASKGDPAQVTLAGEGVGGSGTIVGAAFGDVPAGTQAVRDVIVNNTGVGALNLAAPQVTGAGFSLAAGSTCGAVLPAESSCVYKVALTAVAQQAHSGLLTVKPQQLDLLSAALSGQSRIATLAVTPVSRAFGNIQVGQSATSTAHTLTNSGNLAASNLVLQPPAGYQIATTSCTSSLAAKSSCTFTVQFAPTAAQSYNAPLSITSTTGGAHSIALTGTGAEQEATLTGLRFGDVAAGNSAVLSSTLSNPGVGPLTVGVPSSASVTGAGFAFAGTTCGSSLAAGSNCTITVRYTATGMDAAVGRLTLNTGAGQRAANLEGQSRQVALVVSPTSAVFGIVPVGQSSTSTALTLTNRGNVAVGSLEMAPTAGYSIVNSTCAGSVAPNGTCSFAVQFKPTAAQNYAGTVAIAGSPASSTTLTMTGTGVTFAWQEADWGTPVAACGPSTQSRSVTCLRSDGATVADASCTGVGAKPATSQAAASYATCNYSWAQGSWATPAACGATTSTRSVSCLRSDGTTVADASCASVGAKPATSQAATNFETCTMSWNSGSWTTPAACGATTSTRSVSCLRSDGTTVADASCTGTKPSTSQAATDYGTCSFAWSSGTWNTPSACGATTSTRSVSCVRSDGTTVADASCAGAKPATTQATTSYASCQYTMSYSSYGACSAACDGGTQYRSATCTRSDGTEVATSSCGATTGLSRSCNTQACYTYYWDYSGWSTPSGCGTVTASRTVTCKRSDGATASAGNCTGAKPASTQSTTSYSGCTYSASLGGWGSCSASCGGGTQYRSVSCTRSDGTAASNSSCGSPATSQSCNTQACAPVYSYNFSYGAWTGCSANCNGGTRSRGAACIRSDGATVSNAYCGTPHVTESCNTQACPVAYTYNFSYGGWGACSASCGGGTMSRGVECIRSDGASVATGNCGTPQTSASCNTQACAPAPTYRWSGPGAMAGCGSGRPSSSSVTGGVCYSPGAQTVSQQSFGGCPQSGGGQGNMGYVHTCQ